MKYLAIISAITLAFAACSKSNSDCQPEQYNYTFSNNKKVDTATHSPGNFFASMVNGTNLVFSYHYTSRVCENIADGGYVDQLYIEVPAGSNSFEYNDATELQNGMCYFLRSCFCGNVSSRLVTGTIKGTKVSDTKWSVQANVTEPVGQVSIIFNKTFTLN